MGKSTINGFNYSWLVLWNIFPFSWEYCNNTNWRTHILQRGRLIHQPVLARRFDCQMCWLFFWWDMQSLSVFFLMSGHQWPSFDLSFKGGMASSVLFVCVCSLFFFDVKMVPACTQIHGHWCTNLTATMIWMKAGKNLPSNSKSVESC